ncbi:hypothetical protein V8F20_003359 [Naviculisporaceae sp. PSN 640]
MGRRGSGKKSGQDLTTDQLVKKLIDEFGSVIDEALILAIAGDQDLKAHYDEVRSALSSIAVTAAAEEATGFDPSGLGCSGDSENGQKSPDDVFSANGNAVSTENATTISDSGYGSDKSSKLTEACLSDEEKVDGLLGMFGSSFRPHTVRMILKNANGDLDRAFDELINRQHLADTGQLPTGVDGFYVSDDDERYPRGKGKGRAGRNGKNGKNRLSINYSVVSPIDGEELEGAKGPVLLPSTSSSRPVAERARTVEPLSLPIDMRPAAVGFSRIASLQSSATALARQGPLGRQGLVVYTERLREEHQASAARSFQQAQQLVEEQSRHTPFQIDLHGVTVLDGVRIAKHRVQLWWDKLEGNRELKAKRQSFTVITGVGRHSANGISRLRQAVGAALRNDGWKYETLTGSFRVIGRV